MSGTAEALSLRGTLARGERLAARHLHGAAASVCLADLARGTALSGALNRLAGRSVLLRTADPLMAAVALVELDGVARRIVLCPPDLADTALPGVIATAEIEAVATDAPQLLVPGLAQATIQLPTRPAADLPPARLVTEWVMFTSGTSGPPKMVVHSFAGLTGAIRPAPANELPPVW